MQGEGLYVLMSSLAIPLTGPGWNLISYPSHVTQPVTIALAAIAGYYSTTYSYVPTDTADPWKVYAPSAPAYMNDLRAMSYPNAYWNEATESIPCYLKVGLLKVH